MMNMRMNQFQASSSLANYGWEMLSAQPCNRGDAAAGVTVPPHQPANGSLWRQTMALLEQHVQFVRRNCRAGEQVFLCGKQLDCIYVLGSGMCREVNQMADGREQTTGLHFRGDWLGFDGIPTGRHCCSVVALEPSEVWAVDYTTLVQVCTQQPGLMQLVLAVISAQLARIRDAMMTMGTLNADARVGQFLLQWARSLQERGQRADHISVRMTRADIGSHLGIRVESVSRSLTKIAQAGAIEFNQRGRREISIPSLDALQDFVTSQTDSTALAVH